MKGPRVTEPKSIRGPTASSAQRALSMKYLMKNLKRWLLILDCHTLSHHSLHRTTTSPLIPTVKNIGMDPRIENSINISNPQNAQPPKPPDKLYSQITTLTHPIQLNPNTIYTPVTTTTATSGRVKSAKTRVVTSTNPLSGRPHTPTRMRSEPDVERTPTAQRKQRGSPLAAHQLEEQQTPITPIDYNLNNQPLEDQPMGEDDDNSDNSDSFSQCYETPVDSDDIDPHEHLLTQFRTLMDEFYSATLILKNAKHLEETLGKVDIAKGIAKLANILPIMPINKQLMPLLNRIGELCLKVNSLTDTLENQNNHQPKTLQDSIHAPGQQQSSQPSADHQRSPTQQPRTSTGPAQSNKGTTPTQTPPMPANLRLAHHPTRIVAQFLPNGIPDVTIFLSLFHFSHYCSITTFLFSLNFHLHSLTVHTQPHPQSCC